MVDITVLRLYCNHICSQQVHEIYNDVMVRHGLTKEQYDSVRNNLLRHDLLNSDIERESMRDLASLLEFIKTIHKYLDRATKDRRISKLRDPKTDLELLSLGDNSCGRK